MLDIPNADIPKTPSFISLKAFRKMLYKITIIAMKVLQICLFKNLRFYSWKPHKIYSHNYGNEGSPERVDHNLNNRLDGFFTLKINDLDLNVL